MKRNLTFFNSKSDLASYDDSGVTGHKSCYVLEAGDYNIYAGQDVRNLSLAGSFILKDTIVTEELTEVCAPVQEFKRLKPFNDGNKLIPEYESVPTRTIEPLIKQK